MGQGWCSVKVCMDGLWGHYTLVRTVPHITCHASTDVHVIMYGSADIPRQSQFLPREPVVEILLAGHSQLRQAVLQRP